MTNFELILATKEENKEKRIDELAKCMTDICIRCIKRIHYEQALSDYTEIIEISNFEYGDIYSDFVNFFKREIKQEEKKYQRD